MAEEQSEIPGTELKRIRPIENAADKVKEKLGIIAGLKEELKTLRAKVIEVMHKNEAELDHDEEAGVLIYKRGEYDVRVTGKETLAVKIADVAQD